MCKVNLGPRGLNNHPGLREAPGHNPRAALLFRLSLPDLIGEQVARTLVQGPIRRRPGRAGGTKQCGEDNEPHHERRDRGCWQMKTHLSSLITFKR